MAILRPRAECLCKCYGNHREFVVERDDDKFWDLSFDEWHWETTLQSIAGKARGQSCDKDIVKALECLETRLGLFG